MCQTPHSWGLQHCTSAAAAPRAPGSNINSFHLSWCYFSGFLLWSCQRSVNWERCLSHSLSYTSEDTADCASGQDFCLAHSTSHTHTKKMSSKSRQEIREEENLLNCRQNRDTSRQVLVSTRTVLSASLTAGLYTWMLPFPFMGFFPTQVFTCTVSFCIISHLFSSNELNPTLSQGLTTFRQLLQETILTIAWSCWYLCNFWLFLYGDHYYNSQYKLLIQWTDWLHCTSERSLLLVIATLSLIKKCFIRSCHFKVYVF